MRNSLGIGDDTPVVIYVAEMIPRKRHVDLIEAMSLPAMADAVALLVGDGRDQQRVASTVADRGLADRVRVLGRRADVPDLLAASDVMGFSSIQEGLPKAIMEAMALGLPVVAADIRGSAELLADGAGVLVPPRDPPGLAEGLAMVLKDEDLAGRLRDTALSRLPAYSMDRVADSLERAYELALETTV